MNPYAALYASAAPALRAWMDTHRSKVDSVMRGAEPARITQFASIAEAKEAAKSEAAFIVNEPAFRAWFGKSAVVDTQGKPLLVYHGTDAVFDSFAIGEDGVAYFTPDSRYGYLTALKNVIPAYLSIQRPYFARTVSQIEQLRSFPDAVEELKAEGYDGVIYANPSDLLRGPTGWGNDFPQIVVFRAGQIRSAVKQRRDAAPVREGAPTGDRVRVFLSNFYALRPALARFAGVVPVKEKAHASQSRHPDASNEIVSGKDAIVLYPKFWTHDHDVQAFIFAHELGHWALSGPYGYTTARFIPLAAREGIDVWDTASLPFATGNMEEAFADAFASYYTDRDVLRRYPKWARLVETVAASGAGVPVSVG